MKKRNLIKFFALTLCFITLLSTVVLAKSNPNTKLGSHAVDTWDPFPPTTEFPE